MKVEVILCNENDNVIDYVVRETNTATTQRIVHDAISNRKWTFEDGDVIKIKVSN